MGTFNVNIGLSDGNGGGTEHFDALVDTGASLTVIPDRFLRKIGIEPYDEGDFTLGDGSKQRLPIGQAQVEVCGARAFSPVVFGADNRYLLGATTLQTLRLIADTSNHRLVPAELLI